MDDDTQPVPLPPLAPRQVSAASGRDPWSSRMYASLTRLLPVLGLALLAIGTWWLLKAAPDGSSVAVQRPADNEPDYEMSGFSVRHFGAANAVIQGERLKHYTLADELQIEGARLSFSKPGSGQLDASAPRATIVDGARELVLSGGALVRRQGEGSEKPLEFQTERVVIDADRQALRSDTPVKLRQGSDEVSAQSLQYDHGQRLMELKGAVRGRIASTAGR